MKYILRNIAGWYIRKEFVVNTKVVGKVYPYPCSKVVGKVYPYPCSMVQGCRLSLSKVLRDAEGGV